MPHEDDYSHNQYQPTPETAERLRAGMLSMASRKFLKTTIQIMTELGRAVRFGPDLQVTVEPAPGLEALRLKGEAEAQSIDANLPTATLISRVTEADRLIGVAGEVAGGPERAPDAVRDRARTLLAYVGVCIDMTDQDYAAPKAAFTFRDVMEVATGTMTYEDAERLDPSNVGGYLQLHAEVEAARLMAQESFIVASFGEQMQ